MRHGEQGARVVPFPPERRLMADFLSAARARHLVHALVEVDVTVPRRLIEEHHARTGERLSFTAFVAACLARAVDEDRSVQAYRLGRRRLLVPRQVDVCVLVEHPAGGGGRMAAPHVIRDAARRPLAQIHRELRARQEAGAGAVRRMAAGGVLPGAVVRGLWRAVQKRPRLWIRTAGTVCVTSVGMFGRGAGWGIPISGYTLQLTVGGIARRPGYGPDGALEPREYLSLTVSVDHDVVDGAPAARFVQRLKGLMERGDGLPRAAPPAPRVQVFRVRNDEGLLRIAAPL